MVSQAIEGMEGAEACDKYMFVETYADWADHAKTLKLGAARQARQARSLGCWRCTLQCRPRGSM